MNNLSSFYKKIKEFAENHEMINEFHLLGASEELRGREFDYRTFVMIPSRSNISRDFARPVYSLQFNCAILDKAISQDEESFVMVTEENLFVVSQIQDFLIQEDENCYIDNVDVSAFYNQDENISVAYFDLEITFARKNYNVAINN